MRPASVVLVSVACALLGALAAIGIGSAAGWIGDTDTVIVGGPAVQSGDAASAPLKSSAKPLVGSDFAPAEIYAARQSGVVTIYAFFGDSGEANTEASQGSGFVVSKDGLVLTNSHVVTTAGEGNGPVESAKAVYVQFADGDRVQARIIGYDPFTDVAVIRVGGNEHKLAPVPLGDSSRVVVGEPVAAIGSPFGNESSLTVGVVSATKRSIASLTSIYNVVDAIQIDAPINRGNSGGPLFDARGRVIGINAQIRSQASTGNDSGVGFAVPIDSAKRSVAQLIAHGHVSYAYVGVKTEDVTPAIARALGLKVDHGALVVEVVHDPPSPASRAGLQAGSDQVNILGLDVPRGADLIIGINGRPVRDADDVVRIVSTQLKPGQVATFTILRNGQRKTLAVRLGERSQ
jgi:2-alkenal reductase